MIVWKVTNSRNKSAVACRKAVVQYKIGKSVKAPEWLAEQGYHLFAYRRLKDAKREIVDGERIYKAEGKNTTKKLPLFCNFFKIDDGILKIHKYFIFPKGTIMCKEITLLKEI